MFVAYLRWFFFAFVPSPANAVSFLFPFLSWFANVIPASIFQRSVSSVIFCTFFFPSLFTCGRGRPHKAGVDPVLVSFPAMSSSSRAPKCTDRRVFFPHSVLASPRIICFPLGQQPSGLFSSFSVCISPAFFIFFSPFFYVLPLRFPLFLRAP